MRKEPGWYEAFLVGAALSVSQAVGVTLHAYGVIRHVSAAWLAAGVFVTVTIVAGLIEKRKG
jgi:hypothetical protein